MTADPNRRRVEILAQPDDSTCGPTCLHAVYRYYGHDLDIHALIREITTLEHGGTLGVHLGIHALRREFSAEIVTYNLKLFDPLWFAEHGDLGARLSEQSAAKCDVKLRAAATAYREFLERGGVVRYEDLTASLLERYLSRGRPILTGLSATYLYGCAREYNNDYDTIRGEPTGHFVVLTDYDAGDHTLTVADPLRDNPRFETQYYRVDATRVMNAILLGIVTYDANLLVIEPRTEA